MRTWQREDGVSSMMLLITWGVLMGFLGIAFDLAMAYVYQQQVRTAVEAAVTAGSRQVEYAMRVELKRRDWYWDSACVPVDKNPCHHMGSTLVSRTADVTLPFKLEKDEWAAKAYRKKEWWEAYPGYCEKPKPDGSGMICSAATVVECQIREKEPGALVAARQAFEDNQERWRDSLKDVRMIGPELKVDQSRLRLSVSMGASAKMPTMFLRMLGEKEFPIVVKPVTPGMVLGAESVRLGDDPCKG